MSLELRRRFVRLEHALHRVVRVVRDVQELEVCVCVYDVGGHSGAEPYVHGDAEELCVVLDGTVEHTVGADLHRLAEGDAASYRSSQPHRTVNVGDTPARVLYALTPPTF